MLNLVVKGGIAFPLSYQTNGKIHIHKTQSLKLCQMPTLANRLKIFRLDMDFLLNVKKDIMEEVYSTGLNFFLKLSTSQPFHKAKTPHFTKLSQLNIIVNSGVIATLSHSKANNRNPINRMCINK